MKYNLKHYVSKYVFLVASFLPVAKNVSAKGIPGYNPLYIPPYDGEYTLTFGAGFEHLLPSNTINAQINANDLEGFNPGLFVEFGANKWTGQHGFSDYEYHLGFMGRFDYHNFHSRAYNMNNTNSIESDNSLQTNPQTPNSVHVQDFIGTLNVISDIGWYGATIGANCGLGMHRDNHGNFGPVIALGAGLGYRLNQNFKVNAKWRLNIFPFENLNSKTNPATNPGLRNSFEVGVVYKLPEYFSRRRCIKCSR